MAKLLDSLFRQGFDRSRKSGKGARVRCSQCEALVINGVACHERGCPNQRRECRECGDMVPKGEVCNCITEVEYV